LVGRREANSGAWLKKIRLKLSLEEAVYRLLNVDPSWSHLRRENAASDHLLWLRAHGRGCGTLQIVLY